MNSSPTERMNSAALSSFSGKWLWAITLCGLLVVGCKNPTWTKIASTAGGAVAGAGLGYLAGGEQGAIIGGLAGGAAGFAVGQMIYDKQKDLETRKKVLGASIADANKVLNEHREYNKYLEAQIQQVMDALQRINDAETKGQVTPAKAKQMRQELVPGIDGMTTEVKQTAATFKEFANKMESTPQTTTTAEEYAKEVKIREELKLEEARLTQMLETLAAQRNSAAQ